MSPRRGASYLWGLAFSKLFPRRASRSREYRISSPLEAAEGFSDPSEHTDGFYLYSLSQQIEEETARYEALRLQRGDSCSTEASFSSAMASNDTLKPFLVSSPDWTLLSPVSRAVVLAEDGKLDENGRDRFNSVLVVFGRVYSVAKTLIVVFIYYGVDLDNSPDGLLTKVQEAEAAVCSKSTTLVELMEIVDDLFYTLYGRLMMEIANVDLCALFPGNARQKTSEGSESFPLPEAAYLYKFFTGLKDVLDLPTVCAGLDKQVLWKCQDSYNSRILDRTIASGTLEFVPDNMRRGVGTTLGNGYFKYSNDIHGYRRFTATIVGNHQSEYWAKWRRYCMIYRKPLPEVQLLISEKYLASNPVATIDEVPDSDLLPFVDIETVNPKTWEREIILDNREATLAKLEGKTIGEVRREQGRRTILAFLKERKCVCTSICRCAEECTMEVEVPCPCRERMMRMTLAKRRTRPGSGEFGGRCASLAKAIFESFALFNREVADDWLAAELDHGLLLVEEEVQRQHIAAMQADN